MRFAFNDHEKRQVGTYESTWILEVGRCVRAVWCSCTVSVQLLFLTVVTVKQNSRIFAIFSRVDSHSLLIYSKLYTDFLLYPSKIATGPTSEVPILR